MESSNRIDPLTLSRTIPRQPPRNEFGEVLARSMGPAVQIGAGFLGAVPGIGPALSLAVTGIRNVISAAEGAVARPIATASLESQLPEKGSSFDLLEASRLMTENNNKFSVQYLRLQNDMQRESREYNAVSNIMKTRHDSAKAAINNVR